MRIKMSARLIFNHIQFLVANLYVDNLYSVIFVYRVSAIKYAGIFTSEYGGVNHSYVLIKID